MKQTVCVVVVFITILHVGFALITKIQCSTSDKRTCIEPLCSFVTQNDTEITATYGCRELTKPLDRINVQFKVYAKLFSQYFQIGFFPKFDYCDFIKSYDKKNFIYAGVKLLKARVPESVRECPYVDDQLQVNNLTFTKRDFSLMPTGKYKIICTFSDDYDEKILKMVTHVKI